jgi:phosphoribosylamine-glycine ligase
VPIQKYSKFNDINPLNKVFTRTYSTFIPKKDHLATPKGLNVHKDISSPLIYRDAYSMKKAIIKENIDKSGIYM